MPAYEITRSFIDAGTVGGVLTDLNRGENWFGLGQSDQKLTGLATDIGMDSFILWPADPAEEQVERFATEVAPAVRAAVASARGSAGD